MHLVFVTDLADTYHPIGHNKRLLHIKTKIHFPRIHSSGPQR